MSSSWKKREYSNFSSKFSSMWRLRERKQSGLLTFAQLSKPGWGKVLNARRAPRKPLSSGTSQTERVRRINLMDIWSKWKYNNFLDQKKNNLFHLGKRKLGPILLFGGKKTFENEKWDMKTTYKIWQVIQSQFPWTIRMKISKHFKNLPWWKFEIKITKAIGCLK